MSESNKIKIGTIRTDRATGKKSIVDSVDGDAVHITAIDRLERANPGDPDDKSWAPFVPAKEATHGWIPVERYLAESF